jgi:UDP-N-acetylmuramoylalanine--D-glutamate ligase
MNDTDRSNKRKALVVGLGDTGLSCARFLHAKGVDVSVIDSRDLPPMHRVLRAELPQIEIHTGGFDQDIFLSPDFIVVSPGVSLQEPAILHARNKGIEVIGDVELFLREIDSPVLAITGSNGKSTVTALVGDMCRQWGLNAVVAGNIGVPVLDVLNDQETRPDCFVLELSSFQLESITSLTARAAAILNLSEDHMDRYPDLAAYIAAKSRIFTGDGIAILNRSDKRVMQALPPDKRFISFGSSAPLNEEDFGLMDIDGESWLTRGRHKLMPAGHVPMAGKHNLLNVLAAIALAEQIGVDEQACVAAVEEFQALPHRMELVVRKDGVSWINDSKATNVGAAAAALEGLSNSIILIAGGDGKGADFTVLSKPIEQHARAVVLLGRDAADIARVIPDTVPVFAATDMRDAIIRAGSLAVDGDFVLLAPACASFDMYTNFEERGDHFKTLVRELK